MTEVKITDADIGKHLLPRGSPALYECFVVLHTNFENLQVTNFEANRQL